MTQVAKAIARYSPFSAQKGRIVADKIRNLPVMQALDLLSFTPKRSARYIKQTLESAIANAEHNYGLDIDSLVVKQVQVDEGVRLKRHRARAKGRVAGILKRTCHIAITVSEK